MLRGTTANESLPLPTFGLMDSLLPISADGIEYPVYSLVREKLKDALIVDFPNGDWATRLLSPELAANGCLSLFFVIVAKCHCGFLDSGEDLPGHCRECIEPLSDEAAQLLHVIARIDHEIDPLDGTRPHGVVLERHIVVHCSARAECLVPADRETGPTVGTTRAGLLVNSQFSISHR